MKKWIVIFLSISTLTAFRVSASHIEKVRFLFFAKQLELAYDNSIQLQTKGFNENTPQLFNELMEQSQYVVLLKSLYEKKEELQLNDWLFYLLVKNTTDELFPRREPAYRTMVSWFFMAKSGYKVKLYFDRSRPYLFVYSNQKIFDVPYVAEEGGNFINFSYYFDKSANSMSKLYVSDVNYNQFGKPFDFTLQRIPEIIGGNIDQKDLKFNYAGKEYKLTIKADKNIISFLRTYPRMDLESCAEMPLSSSAYESLIPTFRDWIKGKSKEDAVRMILSFTRTAFTYKRDEDAYNVDNLIFTPEETLFSPYSDCEDRAILFSYMVRELVGLQTVFIEYPAHISAAVNFQQPYGKPISYKGKQYTICEPTGPQDDLGIGQFPRDAIGTYKVYGTN